MFSTVYEDKYAHLHGNHMDNTWENNVKNCKIDLSRAILLSDSMYHATFKTFEAGQIIEEIGFNKETTKLCNCGRWYWLEFASTEEAMMFKLRWD